MKKWMDRIGSLFLIGLSVLIFSSSLKLGVGDFGNPGPGFMPFFASILLFSLSSLVLIKGIIGSSKNEEGELSIGWENLKTPIGLAITLSAYTLIFEFVGYVIATFLCMFTMLFMYGSKRWYVDLLIAALVASVSFLVFCRWLQVQLPIGLFHIVW
jgi:putative tricarboxylic transport membrane protein